MKTKLLRRIAQHTREIRWKWWQNRYRHRVARRDSITEKRASARHSSVRKTSEKRRFVFPAELSQDLGFEERVAWQRLVHVLSHEVNNSLAPIISIARTLNQMVPNTALEVSHVEDFSHGLEVIRERAESLNRFLRSCTGLATVPGPIRRKAAVDVLLARVSALECRLRVNLVPGPKVHINADPDQLEQALINLIKNAVDSVLVADQSNPSPGAVTLSWKVVSKDIEILIQDEGTGLSEPGKLFLPFYTTRQSGSGIGLFLAKRIVEAHRGTLVLKNRVDRSGCQVELRLPMCIVEPEPGT